MSDLLAIEDLTICFPSGGRQVPVVRNLSTRLGSGEFVGLVGESGSGKSMTALAILGLLPPAASVASGSIVFDGRDLLRCGEEEMRSVRGGRIAMIFQEPMTALNPVLTIGFQIAEAIRAHRDVSRAEALARSAELLETVAIPHAAERLDDYPHQLSGGQRQRAMIAMALAADPEILIADEPTTALDVTIQAQILDLLLELREKLGLTVLLITHDLGVVADTCDRALVMYAGRIVEHAPVEILFGSPSHPYTKGLMESQPDLGRARPGQELATIRGQIPDPANLPSGCAFHPRCDEVMEHCDASSPMLYTLGQDHQAACFLHDRDTEVKRVTG